ncbi:MAG TPA: methyltransferase domain-containing protein [Gemmatimonadota bacterium]|nr:methyltransferase domain-containing protein [Gemmatimonadota bacterium]
MVPEGFDPSFARSAAQSYEEFFVPTIGRPVAADLVRAAELRPGERVLDVACGTGIVARLAADAVAPGGSVTGLDPNPAMLAVAREAPPPADPIAWSEAPAEAIPFPDGSFDVALCGMGLQFFSDRTAGLREIRRVLAEGGRLAANVPGPTPPVFGSLAEALARHVSPESAGFVRAVFSLHDEDELRRLASDAGFGEVEVRSAPTTLHLPGPAELLWGYVRSTPLAAAVAGVEEKRRAALERDFLEACAPFVDDGTMTGQVTMTTLIATK